MMATTKHRYRSLLLLLLGSAAACGSSTQSTPLETRPTAVAEAGATGAPAPLAHPTPPKLRLPELARPTRYEVDLQLDPAKEDFTGTISIDLQLAQATDVLWLNGEEISVQEAMLVVGGDRVPVATWAAEHDFVAFMFPRAVGPGPATLNVKYAGKMHRNDGDGIYPVKEGDSWYLYTQFEATDARSAFPCFDEPSYKVPWQLTIHAPETNHIIANTRAESEATDGQGWKAVRFAESKPMPSYLVAFAVGPMDFVDAGKTRTGVPIRIVTPQGRGAEAGYPVQVTGEILAVLEDYFGMPYPYDKLDIVAVPVFNAGAMENPGLVTYKQELVVTKPGEMTESKQQRYAGITAHELAHQWFGNYVTLAFWDDTWLNESFASWAADKAIIQWKPEWDGEIGVVSGKSRSMSADSLANARKIRQPIETDNDIKNAFDGITYGKGSAVLHMFEQWLGEDVMQKGVRAYVAKHAWGNATYADFVAALSGAAGRDLEPVLSTFVTQVGSPLVSFELKCDKGQAPKLAMTQRRYLPVGSKAEANVTWQVPVCVRYGTGKAVGKDCTLLTAATGELALTQTKGCPDWVFPNAEGHGYYRMNPSADLTARLIKHADKLSLRERVNLIADLNALVGADLLPVGDALTLIGKYAKDKSRHMVGQSVGIAAGIDDLVPAELRPNYQRFIRKTYGARARQLGWTARAGETDDVRELRPSLIGLVAGKGADPQLITEATQLTWKWLDDHRAIEPEMVGVALGIAARNGDRKLWERFYAEARKAGDRQERGRMLGAMASFTDPEIIKANYAIVLTDEFELREALGLLGGRGGVDDPKVRELVWTFVKENFDALVAKMPRGFGAYLTMTPLALCTETAKVDMEAFFEDRAPKLEGGPRIYAQALEQMSLCIETKKLKTPGVVAFLKKQ